VIKTYLASKAVQTDPGVARLFGEMNAAGDWSNFGTSGTNVFTSASLNDGYRVGILESSTAAVATASAGIGTAGVDNVVFGFAEHRFMAVCKIPTLSTSAQRFSVFIGFSDVRTTTGTDSVCFYYNDSLNSGKWMADIRSNGTTLGPFDTGITADTNWHRYEITVNAAGTAAAFYIDGKLVYTATSGLPSGTSRATGVSTFIVKSIGTTARTLLTDMMSLELDTSR
jgi:hypothetical protein